MRGGYATILIKSYNKMDKEKEKPCPHAKHGRRSWCSCHRPWCYRCCPASSPSHCPVCVGVPAPIVVVVTVPLAVVAVPLLFCLLPSLSLLLPMSRPQAVVVAVGSGGADTSSFCPCPHFQQQQGMLGNAAHRPIVVPCDVIEDCGWTWTWSSGLFVWTDLYMWWEKPCDLFFSGSDCLRCLSSCIQWLSSLGSRYME